MDEKMLEKRLNQLKSSYDQIPTISNPNSILKRIKDTEKPINKRNRIQFPYVASIIGVLLLAGILSTQLLTQYTQGDTSQVEEKQVSKELIFQRASELEELYIQKVKVLQEQLYFEEVEHFAFVVEAKTMITDFRRSSPDIYAGEKSLEHEFENTKKLLERKLMLPREEMDYIKEHANGGTVTADEEVMSIIEKQEELLSIFKYKWDYLYQKHSKELTNHGDLLNTFINYSDYKGTEISELANKLVENGYYVNSQGEFPEVGINFDSLGSYEGLSSLPNLSDTMKTYLEIKSMKVTTDGALLVSWDELSDNLIKIEEIVRGNKDFLLNKELFEMYNLYFNLYTNKDLTLPNSPIFDGEILKEEVKQSYERFITEYPDTKSGEAISEYYDLLKNNNYKRIDQNLIPKIPQL